MDGSILLVMPDTLDTAPRARRRRSDAQRSVDAIVSGARTPGPEGNDPHHAVAAQLERIIRRGQRSGDFDRALPAGWLAAATFGLGHTAAEQVATAKLSIAKAATILVETVLRLYGANSA